MSGSRGKAERIQELVQQMKAGQITKSELFLQLSQLQRQSKLARSPGLEKDGEVSPPPPSPPPPPPPPPLMAGEDSSREERDNAAYSEDQWEAKQPPPPPPPSQQPMHRRPSTPERRAEIIQRLFEEKRRQRQRQQWQQRQHEGGEGDEPREHEGQQEQRQHLQQQQQQHHAVRRSPRTAWSARRSREADSTDGRDSGPRSPSSPQSPRHLDGLNLRVDARSATPTYANRLARLHAELRDKQMAECTFQPAIRGSFQPAAPFYERVERWHQRRAEEAERKRHQREQQELAACTFAPQINRNARTLEENEAPHERLYRQSPQDKRAELLARARAEEEERFRKECTFKPKLRARTPTRHRPASARKPQVWDEDLTFTPQTNPIRPSMEAAQVYLSNDIVSRLTQPREALFKQDENDAGNVGRGGTGSGKQPMDLNLFMSSAASEGLKRPSSAGPGGRRGGASGGGARPGSSGGRSSAGDSAEARGRFEAFLQRQQQQEQRRQHRLQQKQAAARGPHAPKLCKRSVEMAENSARGSFLQRVARGALRKEQDEMRLKSAQMHDPECTFAPRINEKSKRKPGRSVAELSRGDSLKRETKARLAKLRLEQEECGELTFTPELTVKKGQQSYLRILEEPDTYIQRLQRRKSLGAHRQNKAAQEQEMKELEECTFKPKIHDSPAYVKRIVRSLALAKPARAAQARAQQPARPDWR